MDRIALLDDVTVAHHDNVVGDATHTCEVVADEQCAGAAVDPTADFGEYAPAMAGVKGGGWLIGNDKFGLGDERRGDECPLAQTA